MKNAPDGSVFLCNYEKLLYGASPNLFVQDDAKQSSRMITLRCSRY